MPFIYKSFLPSHLKRYSWWAVISQKNVLYLPIVDRPGRSSSGQSVFIKGPLYAQHHTRLVRNKIILSHHPWPKKAGITNATASKSPYTTFSCVVQFSTLLKGGSAYHYTTNTCSLNFWSVKHSYLTACARETKLHRHILKHLGTLLQVWTQQRELNICKVGADLNSDDRLRKLIRSL